MERHGLQMAGERAQGSSSEVLAVHRVNAGHVQKRERMKCAREAGEALWRERGRSSALGMGV